MDPVVHFEIPANDVKRAKNFYEKTFGWKIKEWKDPSGKMKFQYFGVHTRKKPKDMGIDGGLMKRSMPNQPLTIYMTVKSIDKSLATVVKNGGKICMPKTDIGAGSIACFLDPEGNMIGLHQMNAMPKKKVKSKKNRK